MSWFFLILKIFFFSPVFRNCSFLQADQLIPLFYLTYYLYFILLNEQFNYQRKVERSEMPMVLSEAKCLWY